MDDRETLLARSMVRDFEHDRNAPWWKPKRRPISMWDRCPICFAFLLVVYVVLSVVTMIGMVNVYG